MTRNSTRQNYDMIGMLGTVSSNIRLSGTGEMIFSQAGTRRATPARSDDGIEIAKGTEVVVTVTSVALPMSGLGKS